jgi:hypothetical protein
MEHPTGKHNDGGGNHPPAMGGGMAGSAGHRMGGRPYARLAGMFVFSFLSMYVLMYAMVDRLANVISNPNQFYMAGLMAAPMVFIELILMSKMYPKKKLNLTLIAASVLMMGAFFLFVRQQTAIDDRDFLRSMIPHHAGAILMCNEASLTDPEIKALCEQIIESQQEEIDQMKAMLKRLD